MTAVGNRYTEHEQTEAMLVLALEGGSVRRARELLAAQGFTVSDSTLTRWKASERYAEIQETTARRVEDGLVHKWRENTASSLELQLLATEQAIEEAKAKTLKDPAKAAQAAATAAGIGTDKMLVMTGRPTEITEHRDPRAEIRAMAREFGITIESTAEEVPA